MPFHMNCLLGYCYAWHIKGLIKVGICISLKHLEGLRFLSSSPFIPEFLKWTLPSLNKDILIIQPKITTGKQDRSG